MRMNMKLLLLITIFGVTAMVVRAEDASTVEAPTKKKKASVKKKKVIKANSVPAKSVPLGAVKPAPIKNANAESRTNWIKELKKKLARSQARQNQVVAVAAVRGTETPDSPPLYWKGKKSEGAVSSPEVKEFEMALDSALNGKSDDSAQQLQAFVTKYPESPLAEDAAEALEKLKDPILE